MTVIDPAKDVLAAVEGRGHQADLRWPWVHFGRSTRRTGWKIHLTGLPTNLDALVGMVVESCCPEGTPFKVAATPEVLALLNEGGLGETQVGKAATIYPRDDEDLRRLVRLLRDRTEQVGPHVRDDVWLGGPVHVRYGPLAGHVRRDVLGQLVISVDEPDGGLVPDSYDSALTAQRFRDRFGADELGGYERAQPRAPYGLVAGRYLVVDALRITAVGGLYQAFDMSTAAVRAMMLKFGWAHALSDRFGRDVRDRLRHQEAMHALVSPYGVAPACDTYLEVEAGGVLPIAYQENDNLEAYVLERLRHRSIDHASASARREILDALDMVGRHLSTLHGIGVVHRDLSPANVLLGRDGGAMLSDLELAVVVGSGTPPHGKGTPGFMAPEQYADVAPAPSMDVHAYSALALFCLTGLDPRRLPRPEESEEWRVLPSLARSVPSPVWATLRAGMSAKAGERPSSDEVRRAVRDVSAGIARDVDRAQVAGPAVAPGLLSPEPSTPTLATPELAASALVTLASPALLDPAGRWLSAPLRQGRGPAIPELRRSMNRGVSGPLYLCAGLPASAPSDPALPDDLAAVCRTNARFLVEDTVAVDHGMPGLHFGETGVLLALSLARSRGLSEHEDADVAPLLDVVLGSEIEWLDLTHGAAGMSIGLASLVPLLPAYAERLRARADALLTLLLRTQEPDGRWVTPAGVPGMSGETITGFAHGVAGIAYALALASPRDERCLDAAVRAADWLVAQAVEAPGGALAWSYSDRHPEPWNWWCHGSPGISKLFALLFSLTEKEQYSRLARACLAQVHSGCSPPNLSLCHGLAGLAELLFDAADLLGDPDLRARGCSLIETLAARRFRGAIDTYWVVEDTDVVSADLMVGLAGVVHVLTRRSSLPPVVSWDATRQKAPGL
jgi:serine/threonine protein kinase